jgi:hypothetical protein
VIGGGFNSRPISAQVFHALAAEIFDRLRRAKRAVLPQFPSKPSSLCLGAKKSFGARREET